MSTLTFIEKKLLKDILAICDSYYKTKDRTSCLNSLHDVTIKRSIKELVTVLDSDYNKSLIFPFTGEIETIDFSPYNHVNKRMGFNMDWQCNIGSVMELIQQLYSDFLKIKDGKDLEWLEEFVYDERFM